MGRDQWYLEICDKIAEMSKCLSRKVGAIIVIDNSIIAQGYNGPPRGVPHCVERYDCDEELKLITKSVIGRINKQLCPRYNLGYGSGKGLEWCIAGHAERNALINAARHGIKVKGATMYMNCGIPCTPCLIEIINAGIEEIVVIDLEYYDKMSKFLLEKSGLKFKLFELFEEEV